VNESFHACTTVVLYSTTIHFAHVRILLLILFFIFQPRRLALLLVVSFVVPKIIRVLIRKLPSLFADSIEIIVGFADSAIWITFLAGLLPDKILL
jgi:hypothetical protein